MVEMLHFLANQDGALGLVGDHWPTEIQVAGGMLATAAPYILEHDDGYLEISVANGYAFYQIVGRRLEDGPDDWRGDVLTGRLVRCDLGGCPA